MERLPTKQHYDKCPACGSNRRFFERLTKEAIADKQAMDNFRLFYGVTEGVAVDDRMQKKLPYDTKSQGYVVLTDICEDCGCIYAVELRTDLVIKKFIPNIQLPGGMSRKHPPQANNPYTS